MGNDQMQHLTTEECWAALAEQKFGRLAFVLDGEVHISPINHAVIDEQIVFQTGHGSKLTAFDEQATVAYEIDSITDDESVSVVVRGFTVELDGDEAERAFTGVQPWIDSPKVEAIAIVPQTVSGRRYRLARH